MTCINRNIELKAKKLLEMFPVIVILGARQVGKTTFSKQIGLGWKYIDLEDQNTFENVTRDLSFFLSQYPRNVIFDESQECPNLFKVLRGVIDSNRTEKGRFILTGSSSPELGYRISETLAGRVGILELGTLKANEYYSKPLSNFYNFFYEKCSVQSIKNIIPEIKLLPVSAMQKVWLKGGYPEPVLQDNQDFYNQWMENYRDTYINRDIGKLFPRLNKFAYRRFLSILVKLSGTIINKRDIARAVEVSEGTIREYITIAEGTFLWKSLPSLERNIIKSIIKMPKGYIRDPGLLHYLLRIYSFDELFEHPVVGASFEGFVIEEIIKGLQSTFITNWQGSYYRTRSGAEIDLILEGAFGTLPIEIKQGFITSKKQLNSLTKFIEEHNIPVGMIINQSEMVEWLTPKIVQIPIGCL